MNFIDNLIDLGYLKTEKIISAFRHIRHKDFVLEEYKMGADINSPLPIGFGQTISQPLTVAFMIELLYPQSGNKILDIGSGSGWTTALLAEIVGEKGRVYGMEIIKELEEFSKKNISKYNFIKKGIVKLVNKDGYEGLPEYAPFDRIIVSAASKKIPQKLINQLKVGGRMVLPIGLKNNLQDITLIKKNSITNLEKKIYPGFVFVPLVEQK